MEWLIESKTAELRLQENGMPGRWLVKEKEKPVLEFLGGSRSPEAVTRRIGEREDRKYGMRFAGAKVEKDRLAVYFTAGKGAETEVEIELNYIVGGNGFLLEWGEVKERQGYHLIEITLPSLVSSPAEENAQFFHGENRGGYLTDLAHLDENSNIHGESRFGGYPNASVMPVLGLLKKDALCVMEVQGYVCRTLLEAREGEGIYFGVTAPFRIRGKAETPDILVNQKEIACIEFGLPTGGRAGVSWMDAARMVRNHFQPLKDDFFDERFVYIVQNQLGRKPVELNYGQTEELLERIGNIIGGHPHMAFLTGWSQGGHDTSYPNAYTMNPELGTEEDFFRLKQKAGERYNCTVSLNDNFDDMYKNEFTEERWFREKYIARTAENRPETFETWNGTDKSYITSMYNYMKPGEDGEKRIRCHAESHKLEKAILIDALSWWSIRNDWNPQAPASAVDNLRAKFGIIDTFYNKYGIHVLSELVRYPFIGKLSVAFDNGAAYAKPSDKDIPFLRSVLRGVMYYGGRGGEELDIPDMLYHNAVKHPWFRKGETMERIADIYYLNYVPWFLLKKLDICDYHVENGVYDIWLEKESHIHIDTEAGSWYVTCEGVRIMENYSVTCPLGEKEIAFYAKEKCRLIYDGLRGREVAGARYCKEDGSSPADVWIQEGRLCADMEAGCPIIVTLR